MPWCMRWGKWREGDKANDGAIMSSKLESLASKGGAWISDATRYGGAFHAKTPHALTQAAGYIKHTAAKDENEVVYFRGQSDLFNGQLKPSLYRGLEKIGNKYKRDEGVKACLADIVSKKDVMRYVADYVHEPILQHYGLNTRWIDLVDNIWIALWFACNQARVLGNRNQFMHFEKRDPSVPDSYAYILLVGAEATPVVDKPGFFEGSTTELIDLRLAAPSTFLRPHAQHGLLLRTKKSNHAEMDFARLVKGVIAVSLADAIDWLGTGRLLGPHTLFPPPHYDHGYFDLLRKPPDCADYLGSIQFINP